MLRLIELRFKNIGRFVETQVIRFDGLGNIIQIDGANLNTGGSSGSGKSTIFNALDYLLGLNDIPVTVLQSRLTEEGISVSATFQWDDIPITISRSKSRGLVIEIYDMVIKGSKLAEEKLDEIIAMPRDLFQKILHKRQGEGGFFLDFGPKDTHKFLSSCLNLSSMHAKLAVVEKRLADLELQKTASTNSLNNSFAALKATQDAVLTLGTAPTQDMHPELIEILASKRNRSQSELEALNTTHMRARMALDSTRPPNYMQPFDYSAIKNHEEFIVQVKIELDRLVAAERERQNNVSKEVNALKAERMSMEFAIANGNAAQKESIEIAGKIKKIRDSICHTCEQHWADEKSKAEEANLLVKLMAAKNKIDTGTAAQQRFLELGSMIEQLQTQLAPRVPEGAVSLKAREQELFSKLAVEKEKEKAHNQSEMAKATAINNNAHTDKLSALMSSQALEAEQARGQADLDRRAYEAANNQMRMYEDSKARYDRSVAQLKSQEETYGKQIKDISEKLTAVTEELGLAEELKKAFKSYISRSFEDALAYISDSATRIIRRIPNMANATVQLEGTKETQDGKVKEEVNAVLNVDGEINVPLKSFSGGERSAIDLAIDLAVIDLIELKTGKGIDIFILDEPFNGLGSVEIEMALEVLRNSNSTKRLVIVDHNPEVKQMVQDRIVVTRDGTTSNVSRAA